MSSCVVDTSALFAIFEGEPEALETIQRIQSAERAFVSTATILEANSVALRYSAADGPRLVEGLVQDLRLLLEPFDTDQMHAAIVAYRRFGRGTGSKARLNLGDCFSYALARTRSLPLLYKGDDFSHTDIASALDAQQ